MEDFNKASLWNASLKAFFHIGSFVQGLGGTVLSNLTEAHENLKSSETAIQLLECYSCKLLPGIHENGGSEDFVVQFAVDIWCQAGNCMDFNSPFEEEGLLDAMTKAMNISVVCCSVESQNVAIQKAYSILSSHNKFQLNGVGGLALTPGKYDISPRYEGLLLLFALRPKTHIPNIRVFLHLFIIALLKGVVLVSQALGSMINKLVSKSNGAENSGKLTLEEALDVIFNSKIWFSCTNLLQRFNGSSNGSEIVLTDLCTGITQMTDFFKSMPFVGSHESEKVCCYTVMKRLKTSL